MQNFAHAVTSWRNFCNGLDFAGIRVHHRDGLIVGSAFLRTEIFSYNAPVALTEKIGADLDQ